MATNIVFPTDVGCWKAENFKNTSKKADKQLGGNIIKGERSSIEATLLIKGDNEASILWNWWNIELQQGRLPFLVTLNFFNSVPAELEVQLDGKLEIKKIGKKYTATMIMLIDPVVDTLINSSEPIIPIIDFSASENLSGQIEVTWTDNTVGVIFYDLYSNGVLLSGNIYSGFKDSYYGTRDYYVIASNFRDTAQSNTDSGTGLPLTGLETYDNTNIATEFIA